MKTKRYPLRRQPCRYICTVKYLDNPVYDALTSGDAHLALGTDDVKFFDEAVSPFAGFPETYEEGFVKLHELLPPERKILYATPHLIEEPNGWKVMAAVEGLQFAFEGKTSSEKQSDKIVPLDTNHVDEMVALAALTRPGPFNARTIEFGHYHGIFDNNKLVAMTGQRLHVYNHTEISAVCTHPDHLGEGYAGALLQHQLHLIQEQGQKPFLHVRADNERAIGLYKRLGFEITGPMNFYFMKKI